MNSLSSVMKLGETQAQQAAGARASSNAPGNVTAAVRQASAKTGVDFAYLMEKAAAESGFRTDVKASTSSATGLYQFIDSTWLNTMKEHGGQHGFQRFADSIQKRSDGTLSVADPEVRQQILELRKNPEVASLFAAEFAKDNKQYLQENVGGKIGPTEMYLAHFLGPGGATKFLNAMKENPGRAARDLFPEAASANQGVFYDRATGQPTSLADIHKRFALKFTDGTGEPPPSDRSQVTASLPGASPFSQSAPLSGQPLSMYTVLALNALETPLDRDDRSHHQGEKRVRDEHLPVKPYSGFVASWAQTS